METRDWVKKKTKKQQQSRSVHLNSNKDLNIGPKTIKLLKKTL